MIPRPGAPEIFADRYEVQGLIGSGIHGTVHRALDRLTGETVALKRWYGQAASEAEAQILADGRAIARLAGPGIVSYRSMGFLYDAAFVATELVMGDRLSDRLSRGAFSVLQAINLAKRLAWGLARLHKAGLAHRNLKPANVLLPDGATDQAKIAEAWIETHEPVRVRWNDKAMTDIVGFLSPQIIRRGHPSGGPRDDVYSLGAILFRCLSGKMPFPEHDAPTADTMLLPATRVPRELASLGIACPDSVESLLGRALSHDPAARPADAVEPCHVLFEAAQLLGSEDTIEDAHLSPDQVDLPPHFEARK